MTITSRIDAVTHIPESHRDVILPPPKSVKIELTARCNYACSFCATNLKLREKGTMSQAMYENLALEIREAGVEELGLFFLGESFLVPWLPEAIEFAKGVCEFPYVFLTTNGSLANPAVVKKCMHAGLDSLKWSYNYAHANQMRDIAGVAPKYWWKVQAHIKEAWLIRQRNAYTTGLYASYIRYDGEQGERMEAALAEIRPYVDEIYALPLYNQAGFALEREQAKGWKPIPGNIGRDDNRAEPLPCWSCFTEGHITWDGSLGACCFSHDSRFDMADLQSTSFKNGWNSAPFMALRKAHLMKDVTGTVCERCVIYE